MTRSTRDGTTKWPLRLRGREFSVRYGGLNDLESVLAIDPDILDGRDSLPAYFHELVTNPRVVVYVAEDRGQVVSFPLRISNYV